MDLKPYWPMEKNNLAPRLAIAFSPNDKTSIRAGFGLFYDHYGQAIVNSFSQFGSYGLQGEKQTPNDALTPDGAPRLTNVHTVPAINGVIADEHQLSLHAVNGCVYDRVSRQRSAWTTRSIPLTPTR